VFTDDNGVQQVLYTVNGNGDIFSFHVTPLTDDMLIIGVLKGGTQPGWLKGDPLVAITSAEVWPQAKRLSARAHASTFIADLSVGTAQMGNLSVETLKIADEAVTVMRVVTSEVLISMVAIFSQYNYSYVVEGGLMYIFGDDFGSITLSNQHPTKPQYAVLDLSLEMFNEYENAKLLVCISEDPDKFPAWWADSYAEWTSAIVGAGMVQANKHYISDDANLIEWGGQNSSVHLRLLAPEETVTFYLYIVHHDAAMNLGNAEKGLAPKITLKGQVLAK
jgi:hypothetical protein